MHENKPLGFQDGRMLRRKFSSGSNRASMASRYRVKSAGKRRTTPISAAISSNRLLGQCRNRCRWA